MTLYSGQNYRMLIARQEVLGKVHFSVRDIEGNIIFSSKENGDIDHWDFNLELTQQVIVEIEAPSVSTDNGFIPRGCVALLVGFKKQSKFLRKAKGT